jgi:hypothetical protein
MSDQKPDQEKIGWVEIALILILILEIVVIFISVLGPNLANLV